MYTPLLGLWESGRGGRTQSRAQSPKARRPPRRPWPPQRRSQERGEQRDRDENNYDEYQHRDRTALLALELGHRKIVIVLADRTERPFTPLAAQPISGRSLRACSRLCRSPRAWPPGQSNRWPLCMRATRGSALSRCSARRRAAGARRVLFICFGELAVSAGRARAQAGAMNASGRIDW